MSFSQHPVDDSSEIANAGGEEFVDLPGERSLSRERIDLWKRSGYVIVRDVFPASEVAALSDDAWRLTREQHLIDKNNLRCRFRETFDGAESLWETFDPVIDLSPECARFSGDPRLMEILHDLYGEPACLFKDKLIFKQPGTKGYELHQDWISWPGFPRSFLTVLIPIDPSTAENGCTEVFPGYHRLGPLTPQDGQYHQLPDTAVEESRCIPLELQPGDIAVFDGFTPHRSSPNRSQFWRRQLYLSYNAESDGGHQREAHYVAFHDYLQSRCAGQDRSASFFR